MWLLLYSFSYRHSCVKRIMLHCNLGFVVYVTQDEECTNAGRGSNLTEDGQVECDASVMDGHSGAFGAVGAVPGTFEIL